MINREEHYIIISVVHNIAGYPFSQKGIDNLGFHRKEGRRLFDLLLGIDQMDNKVEQKNYELNSDDKKIILLSFKLFLSEIDDYETVPLTDHTKPEVQALYEKLKILYHDAAQSVG